MTTEDRSVIVTVWLDTTSDDHGWVVDTDIVSGGESETIKMFPPTRDGYDRAVAFVQKAAAKRGCKSRITAYESHDDCEDCYEDE
jgi:hypothetical protein